MTAPAKHKTSLVAPSRRLGNAFAVILSLSIVTLAAVVFLQRQIILDWWQLRGYEPSAEIAQLAAETTMTDQARRIFYVQDPRIEESASFNEHCRSGEFTIVLGCYVSGKGIFVFNVSDERLYGVKEVTSAHEMLHAAYERLSSSKKKQVDSWTASAFEGLVNDRVRANIEQYRANDPSSVPNELHSILGTEVAKLPAELETYYSQYFTNRSAIVAYSEKYESALNERKVLITEYETKLTALKEEIDAINQNLTATGASLAQESSELEAKRSSTSAAAFNQQVASYNAKVRSYNKEVARVSGLIDSYNAMLAEYTQIVVEQQGLFEAIDSRPESAQSQ